MRVFLEVLGASTGDSSAGVLIFFDEARYIFECGDGTQRFCTEYSIRLSRLRALYLTSLAARSMGGLLGMMLTMADAGKNEVDIIAPEGIQTLLDAARPFCYRPAMATRIVEVPQTGGVVTEDENLSIDSVVIGKCVSYIARMRDIPGKFNPKRAVELGVKRGRDFGRLARGEVVETERGTRVTKDDVMGKSTPGSVVLIAACPNLDAVDDFVGRSALSPEALDVDVLEPGVEGHRGRNCLIVHLASREVLSDKRYQKWANSFGPKATHVLLHETFTSSRPVFSSQAQAIATLNKTVDKDLFPLPQNTIFCTEGTKDDGKANKVLFKDKFFTENSLLGSWLVADIGLRYMLAPVASRGIDMRTVPSSTVPLTDGPVLKWEFDDQQDAEMDPPECVSMFTEKTGEIRFLGTAGAIPGKLRNVSGIFLDMFDRGGLIMDCGEGTWGQLVRAYGQTRAVEILKELKFVFISHMHADHHLGLMTILDEWEKLRRLASKTNENLARLLIIGPCYLYDWLTTFCSFAGSSLYRFIDAAKLSDPQDPLVNYFPETMGIKVACVPVIHCPYAYGIVVTDCVLGWKVVYSGDTLPCAALAEAGAGATLAIHEATLEDEMKAEATSKGHCTVSQALDICANKMGAWRTLLTHFSQRYAQVPKLDPNIMAKLRHARAAVAFDLMSINFSRLRELPAVMPAIRELFAEEVALLCSSDQR